MKSLRPRKVALKARASSLIPVWRRSLRVDTEGRAWTPEGVRARLIVLGFRAGMSIEDLCNHSVAGTTLSRECVEDCIRWGITYDDSTS